MNMKLEIPEVKNHVVPIRLSPKLFLLTKKIAKENKSKHSMILRLLIEKGIKSF